MICKLFKDPEDVSESRWTCVRCPWHTSVNNAWQGPCCAMRHRCWLLNFWKSVCFFAVCHFFVCLVVVFRIGILGPHCEELRPPCTGKSGNWGNRDIDPMEGHICSAYIYNDRQWTMKAWKVLGKLLNAVFMTFFHRFNGKPGNPTHPCLVRLPSSCRAGPLRIVLASCMQHPGQNIKTPCFPLVLPHCLKTARFHALQQLRHWDIGTTLFLLHAQVRRAITHFLRPEERRIRKSMSHPNSMRSMNVCYGYWQDAGWFLNVSWICKNLVEFAVGLMCCAYKQ